MESVSRNEKLRNCDEFTFVKRGELVVESILIAV